MKTRLFVDPSAWYALADKGDANHTLARDFFPHALAEYRDLVTTNHILGETYTLIRSRLGYEAVWEFLKRVRQSQRVERIFVTESWEQKAYTLLKRYSDHDFSFVDGTSFVVMKAIGISDAFAFDRHFSTAGFTTLPH